MAILAESSINQHRRGYLANQIGRINRQEIQEDEDSAEHLRLGCWCNIYLPTARFAGAFWHHSISFFACSNLASSS